MTTFFNKKEEVIDIKLTPYGKHKLSLGEMQPAYYSFYDDGILYDGEYAGITETQNNIVDRIKDGTPYLRPQTDFTSSLAEIRTIDLNETQYFIPTKSNAKFFRALGRNSPWGDFAPAWNVTVLQNSVSLSGTYIYEGEYAIPTLSASVIPIKYSSFSVEDEDVPTEVFLLQENGRLLIDLLELNTTFKGNGNYDIEVFKMPDEDKPDDLIPLNFINEGSPHADRLQEQEDPYTFLRTFSGDEEQQRNHFPSIDPSYVEYFLSVRVDTEIVDVSVLGADNLYSTNQKLPESLCRDENNFGVDV